MSACMHPCRTGHCHTGHCRRNGTTLTEVIVAAGMVIAIASVMIPLIVSASRLRTQSRYYQQVTDDLSNQMDRLVALPTDQREQALEQLKPSAHVLENLQAATLTGETSTDSNGTTLTLRMQWQRPGDPPPIQLTAWLDCNPETGQPPKQSPEQSQPTRGTAPEATQ